MNDRPSVAQAKYVLRREIKGRVEYRGHYDKAPKRWVSDILHAKFFNMKTARDMTPPRGCTWVRVK